jgi:sialic acid synthase SpsE
MKKIRIGDRNVGDGESLYFIADIAANHDGDLNRAFKLIERAKDAGADAAKFQNFQASKIVSRYGFESLGGAKSHQSSWGKSVFDVYKDASLPFAWTEKLKAKCDEVGIEYFTSPYDFESVDCVDPYVNVYKIGSGDITWVEIIEYIAKKGKPVLIATGASTMKDVVRAMNVLESINDDIVLMQCNTNYTVNSDNFKYTNLNVLKTYKRRFPNAILGLSDHTLGHSTVLGAVALGARIFEKHFTDDNDRVGPDHKFAMNPEHWKEMVIFANELYKSLGNGVKDVEANEEETVVLQRRALRFTRNLSKGHVLSKSDMFPLRPIPSDGIPPYAINDFIERKLKYDVKMDDYLKKGDIEL